MVRAQPTAVRGVDHRSVEILHALDLADQLAAALAQLASSTGGVTVPHLRLVDTAPVRAPLRSIYRKLDVRSRWVAARWAQGHGLA